MITRISKLIGRVRTLKVDGVLVTDDVNITYLTGFKAKDSWLLVTGRGSFYITDSRYTLEAEKGLKGRDIKVVQFKDSLAQVAMGLVQKFRIKILGVDERHLFMAQFRSLEKVAPSGLKLKAVDGVVDYLRMIKEPEEIAMIKAAIKVNLEAFRYLGKRIRVGRTEQDLLSDLEAFVRQRGVGFSFPPIIASGPNSAMPHARVSGRKLRQNEPVLVDCGIEIDGYKSDLTRMFFLGKMAPSYKEALCNVKEAQQAAIRVIKPGVLAKEVDAEARNNLKKNGGFDRLFSHSLGHGVGLDIHEMPRISSKSGAVLEENMVFTVEPGVYMKNRYGIRLEEMVLVTHSGCEVLSVDHN